MPRLCELYRGICLTTEENAWRNLSQAWKNLSHKLSSPVTQFQTYTMFNDIKNDIFETCVEFFLIEMRSQWDKGGRRTLLGSNTGSRISCCGQTCQCALHKLMPFLPECTYCMSVCTRACFIVILLKVNLFLLYILCFSDVCITSSCASARVLIFLLTVQF